jgi:hypothetical protein
MLRIWRRSGGMLHGFSILYRQGLGVSLNHNPGYPLFHILGDYSIEHWKRQIALIKGKTGL